MINTKPHPFLTDISKDNWTLSVFHGEVRTIGEKVWRAVMKKHNYTCQRCGFTSKQFQEVSHRDGNHRNMSEENLECLCPLCHQCEHLPLAGKSKGAELVWLPELSQESLNLMSIAAMVAMMAPKDSPWSESGKQFFNMLKSRSYVVENQLSSDAKNPYLLAQVLLKSTKEERDKMAGNLDVLKLLPRPLRFLPQAEYWSQFVFKKYELDKWLEMIDSEKLIKNVKDEKKRMNDDG